MAISVYERRKFVRVDANLAARLNRQFRAAVKKLSLGGCLVLSPQHLSIRDSIQLEFSAYEEDLHLAGSVIHTVGENQYGVRFEPITNDLIVLLMKTIEKFQESSSARRSSRLRIQREAILDKESAMLTNLSESGCFLRTPTLFNQGNIVEIRFRLEEDEIHLAAQVRWMEPRGIGVEYLSPEPSQVNCISDFITKQTEKTPTA